MKSFIPARIESYLTLLALVVCLTTSCDRFTDWREISWDHYATGFFTESKMAYFTPGEGVLEIEVFGYHRSFGPFLNEDGYITIKDTGSSRRNRLEQIVAQFGEAKHPSKVYEGFTQPYFAIKTPHRYFLETPIDKVELTSDIDWGEESPRGTVLNAHFWFLGRCHDRYAKHLDDPGRQAMPSDFTVESKDFWRLVKEAYSATTVRDKDINTGYYEVILSPLSEVNFRGMDYLEPHFYLTSDSPYFSQPQTITAKTTFRDGSTDSVTITLTK